MTDEQKFVVVCIRFAKQHRGLEPFDVARAKGWTRERFDIAHAQVQAIELERWRCDRKRDNETDRIAGMQPSESKSP